MPFDVITDQFDHNKSAHYNLSIRLSADGFSFSVYNPIRDSNMLKQSFAINQGISIIANFKQAFKELDFLGYTYKHVDVTIDTKRFTLIPEDLFIENQTSQLFYYNFPQKEDDLVLHNTLTNNKAELLFAVSKSLYHFLQDKYTSLNLYSAMTKPAEEFALRSRFGCEKKMFAHAHLNRLDVYAFDRSQLALLNTYACTASSDRLYYLLLAWKQLQMDQLEDELYLMGTTRKDTHFIHELSDFINHVSILDIDFLYS